MCQKRTGCWASPCRRLERLHDAATERSGRCLADTYIGIAAHYEWECAEGHRWTAVVQCRAG